MSYTSKHPQFNNLPYKFGDFDAEPKTILIMEQYEISLFSDLSDKMAYAFLHDNNSELVFEMGDKNPSKPPKKKQKKKKKLVNEEPPVKKPRKKPRMVTS